MNLYYCGKCDRVTKSTYICRRCGNVDTSRVARIDWWLHKIKGYIWNRALRA